MTENLLSPEAHALDLDAAIAHFLEHGWARLGPVLAPQAAEAMRTRAEDLMLGRVTYEGLFFQRDSPTGRYAELAFAKGWEGPSLDYRKIEKLEKDPLFRAWIGNPLFERIARRVIGDRISLFRAVLWTKSIHGGTELPWHQDGGAFWGVDRDPILQIWTALDDAPVEAGCVEVVSGTHRDGLVTTDGGGVPEEVAIAHRAAERAIPLPAKAGEGLLIHNHVWHRSGLNSTGKPRRAVSFSYMDGDTKCRRRKRTPRQFFRPFDVS